jgi:hypothetical protein
VEVLPSWEQFAAIECQGAPRFGVPKNYFCFSHSAVAATLLR